MENKTSSVLVERSAVDSDGYFVGKVTVQKVGDEILLPPNVVDLAAPAENVWTDAYFYKLSEDKSQWVAVKKPTTAAECVDFGTVSHTSESMRDKCLRDLFQSLTMADMEHYRVDRGDDLSWTVVAIPEKTAEEKAAEEKAAKIAELKRKLADTDYIAAKIAEGAATKEEYADVLAQRQAWRDEINELEGEA